MAKEVAVKKENAVVTGSWRDKAAKSLVQQQGTLAKLPVGGSTFVSFRNGMLTLGGQRLINPMPIILLASGFERTYYSKDFQADVKTAPDCYSFDGVSPHEASKASQSDSCKTCRWNAFGSRGKGKGCKEGARLAFVSADAVNDADRLKSEPILQARLSVMNSRTFAQFASAKSAAGEALWEGVTVMRVEPDPKTQYAVSWKVESVVLSEEIMDAIAARADEAEAMVVAPYPDFEEDTPAAPTGRRKF